MKTKSTVGRLITYFSKWRKSSARVAAMLLLLCTTALPAWAEYEMDWERMVTDQGGGEVQYKGYSDNILNQYSWRDYSNFTTKKTFNPANDQFYWEFYVFVNYGEKLNGFTMDMGGI